MKIELPANTLAAALSKVRAAVPGRDTIPILDTFRMEARAGFLSVVGTQVDIQASASVPCDVLEEGCAAISSKVAGIVKGLGKSVITLEAEEGSDARAVVTGPRQRYEFGRLPADQFPIMPALDEGEGAISFEIDAPALAAALNATKGTVSPDKHGLEGVCMCRDGASLVFVATDGKRFSHYAFPLPPGASSIATHTISTPAVRAILSALSGEKGIARVSANRTFVSVSVGEAVVMSRLINGDFVSYQGYMRKIMGGAGVRVSRSELSEAVARIVALRAETKAPVVVLRSSEDAVHLISDKRGRNEGSESVDAEVDAPTEFGLDAGYLAGLVGVWPEHAILEIANKLPGEAVTITSKAIPGLLQFVAQMSP